MLAHFHGENLLKGLDHNINDKLNFVSKKARLRPIKHWSWTSLVNWWLDASEIRKRESFLDRNRVWTLAVYLRLFIYLFIIFFSLIDFFSVLVENFDIWVCTKYHSFEISIFFVFLYFIW
jgi:hypothetical protein